MNIFAVSYQETLIFNSLCPPPPFLYFFNIFYSGCQICFRFPFFLFFSHSLSTSSTQLMAFGSLLEAILCNLQCYLTSSTSGLTSSVKRRCQQQKIKALINVSGMASRPQSSWLMATGGAACPQELTIVDQLSFFFCSVAASTLPHKQI